MPVTLAITALALLVCSPMQIRAALLIDAGPASTEQVFTPGNYVAGSEFTSTESFTIRSLGYLDAEGNGLTGSHLVGLWDSGQTLLTSITITPTSFTVLSAHGGGVWYLEDIAPVVIGPGTYRVAGLQNTDSNALSNDKIENGVALSAGYVRTEFPNGGFAFPNLTFGSEAIRATLSTDSFGETVVPEPSSMVMAGLSMAGLAVTAVRRRNRAQLKQTN